MLTIKLTKIKKYIKNIIEYNPAREFVPSIMLNEFINSKHIKE